MSFAVLGKALGNENPATISGKQAEGIAYGGKVIYDADPRVILEFMLLKSGGINRWFYNATTAQAFDAAYSQGQTVYDNWSSSYADLLSAANNLRSALRGLTPVRLQITYGGATSGEPTIANFNSSPMNTVFYIPFEYDGDGTLGFLPPSASAAVQFQPNLSGNNISPARLWKTVSTFQLGGNAIYVTEIGNPWVNGIGNIHPDWPFTKVAIMG